MSNQAIQLVREDILSITEEKLKQMTNAGLLKRARKAIDKGDVPTLSLDDELTLTANFADEHTVVWQKDIGIAQTSCTCPAPMCRHRVQVVLSYREQFDNPEVELTSPHLITVEDLTQFAGKNLLPLAKKLAHNGILLKLNPSTHCPTVNMPMASVQFWGGENLHEATCDCLQKQHCEHILLAGLAYATLDQEPTQAIEFLFDKSQITALLTDKVNHKKSNKENNKESQAKQNATEDFVKVKENNKSSIALTDNLNNELLHKPSYQLHPQEQLLFTKILTHGAVGGYTRHERLFDDVQVLLKKTKELWLQQILADLINWLKSYEHRRSDFTLSVGFEIISDYLLRSLTRNNPKLITNSLGVGIKHETPISTARLTSLGCRLSVIEDDEGTKINSKVILADNSQTLLVHNHTWSHHQGQSFYQLPKHKLNSRITLEQLACGQLTCHRAKRMANHEIKLNTTRVTYNQVLPQTANWQDITANIGYQSITQLKEVIKQRPISILQGRYSQPNFAVLTIKSVIEHGYDPVHQSYVAIVTDLDDTPFVIKRQHRAFVPDALQALALAFNHFKDDRPAYVSGTFSEVNNIFTLDPWAVVTDKLYVIDCFNINTSNDNDNQASIQDSHLIDTAFMNVSATSKTQQLLETLKNELSAIIFQGTASSSLTNLRHSIAQLESFGFTQLAKVTNVADNNKPLSNSDIMQLICMIGLYLECG